MSRELRKDISERVWESDEIIEILDRLGPGLEQQSNWPQFMREVMGEYERVRTELSQRRSHLEDCEDEHEELGVGA